MRCVLFVSAGRRNFQPFFLQPWLFLWFFLLCQVKRKNVLQAQSDHHILEARCFVLHVHFLLLAQKENGRKEKGAPRKWFRQIVVGIVPSPCREGDFNIRRFKWYGGNSQSRLLMWLLSFCGRVTGLHFRKGDPELAIGREICFTWLDFDQWKLQVMQSKRRKELVDHKQLEDILHNTIRFASVLLVSVADD